MIIFKKSIDLIKNKKLKIVEKKVRINKKENIYIKVESCGICSSDLKFIKTGSRIKKFPITLGHEISGKISNSKNVILCAEVPCEKCYYCKNLTNNTNLCSNPVSIGSNFNGGFSNYFIVKKKIFKRIPKIVYQGKILKYGSLAESLACVINGLEVVEFDKNKKLIIVGAGYMGLLFVSIAKYYGSKNISVIDYNIKRLNLAKKLGANKIFKFKMSKNKSIDKLIKPTNYNGYDSVVSANGNIDSHELSIKLASKKGVVNIFGGTPKNKKISFDTNQVHYREVKITGSFSSNLNHLKKAFEILKSNKIDFSKIVSSYANYNNFNKKIMSLMNRKETKVIFRPNNEI